MKTIAFSTTRQWNPGDEFIFRGIRAALRRSGVNFNTLIYNRNPVVNPPDGNASRGHLKDGLKENSLDTEGNIIADYAIVAGTPEWAEGERSDRFLNYIKKHNLRVSFLGVGLANDITPSPLLRRVIEKQTDVFVCRDQRTFAIISKIFPSATLLSCPSILSADFYDVHGEPGRVGCMIQGTKVLWQSIPLVLQESLYLQYAEISRHFDVQYVAHFPEDLENFPRTNAPIHYSGIAEDFYDIYRRFDVVVGPRLYGCGIAASMGIPSICISHDGRGSASELFGSFYADEKSDLLAILKNNSWQARSQLVVELRAKAEAAYREVIKEIIPKLA